MTRAFAYIAENILVQVTNQDYFKAVEKLTRKLRRHGYRVTCRTHMGGPFGVHEVLLTAIPRDTPHQSKD